MPEVRFDEDIAKGIVLFLITVFLVSFFSSFFGIFDKNVCGDGTPYGECSENIPYFCSAGILAQNAPTCKCPANSFPNGNLCEWGYQSSPRNASFSYVLNGENRNLEFTLYGGMEKYLGKHPQILFYSNGENYSLEDYKMRVIDEPEQKKLLMPLVVEIQNLAKNRDDQARIAVSLVQNIPYEKGALFNPRVPLSWNLKYPYDVLYQNEGLCGSKTDLLAFLLKELGYEVVIFHYAQENHEAVGVRCPERYSLNNTGYCFIETTQPAIISYSTGEYSEQGKLVSNPEIIKISEGVSLGGNIQEYRDARALDRIYTSSGNNDGKINLMEYFRYNQIARRYGLANGFAV